MMHMAVGAQFLSKWKFLVLDEEQDREEGRRNGRDRLDKQKG
jgi:hypothetical protein